MGQERLAERVQISAGNKECKAWSGCTYDEYQDVLSCLWRAVQIRLLSVEYRSARFDWLRRANKRVPTRYQVSYI